MLPSFRLIKIFDIDIRIHASFFILPAAVSFFYARDYGYIVGVRACTLILLVFACILGHELCHSLQARRFGILVPRITLYPIGGVAGLQRIPREPKQEFAISIVGPLFNFTLALLLFFPFYYWLGRENLFSPSLDSWPKMWANVFWLNPVLGLFNLVPAFPMDGGRILRSLLARKMSYLKATLFCVNLGRIFAILFLLLGVFYKYWTLALVGLFIYLSADSEKRQAYFYDEHDSQN